jgi:hypothetical protein
MIAVLLFLTLDAPTAAARLDDLRHQLAARGKTQTMNELERLGRDAPDTDAGAHALLWLGDLARENGEPERATVAYQRARPMGGEVQALADRGLGDLALRKQRFVEAARLYDSALPFATPLLRAELEQKRALAVRLRARALAAWIALGVVAAALAWFVARIVRRKTPLQFPTEILYVLPVYALLVLGGWGRDANVFHALILCAAASLPLITLSALAAMRSPARPWLHLGVLGAASVALFYAIVWRCELIDSLLMTAAPM